MLLNLFSKLALLSSRLLLRLETDGLLFQTALQFLILQSVFQKRRLLHLCIFHETLPLGRVTAHILFHTSLLSILELLLHILYLY